ncbi:hypothetical protein XELAEV_18009606mg [Xenopus laevis]|uniref:Uncharacterized protein n=1 Tax=Xenopus laevis TaxID=8355 RepID=A0A974I0Q6_XENLA|nr:hypothetical protein XELAEV_18009606mg [Xenopus laevis]
MYSASTSRPTSMQSESRTRPLSSLSKCEVSNTNESNCFTRGCNILSMYSLMGSVSEPNLTLLVSPVDC